MESILKNRQIEYLVHFTYKLNFSNILKQGILPINHPEFQGEVNDNDRYDKRPNCSCLSISFPNYRMFYRCRKKRNLENWLILGIDARILLEDRRAFCCFTNAATGSGKYIRPLTKNTLEDLFYETKMYPDNNMRQRQNIPLNYTTDPQAEILIEGIIPPEYIKVLWHNNKPLVLPSGHQIIVQSDPSLFSFRPDSLYWSK